MTQNARGCLQTYRTPPAMRNERSPRSDKLQGQYPQLDQMAGDAHTSVRGPIDDACNKNPPPFRCYWIRFA